MNRYKIRNKKNGLEFEVLGDVLPARQPEWGKPPQVKRTDKCTPQELLEATRFFEAPDPVTGAPVQYCEFADEMHVHTAENIDAEITAASDKKTKKKNRLKKLKDTDLTKVNNLQDVKDLLKDILEELTD